MRPLASGDAALQDGCADQAATAAARWIGTASKRHTKAVDNNAELVRDVWGALMAASQAGDKSAYRQLLTELLPYLRRIAHRRLPTHEDAEDVVQETLVTIHAIRHTYDPSRPFRPWLVTIARRRIADRLHQLGRRNHVEAPPDRGSETFFTEDWNLAEDRIRAGELRAAITALPPGQRRAIELTKLRELSLAEASTISGVSVTALKVGVHRAVATLRRRFVGSE
ncbi:RNA polymerase sigma-70 factor (ECF subfamily) [Constrictibacter sp. MBR-5]|jgi:RNA polymerase sigma-70 factor (ECF subfamily)|uniref:RNA polymerase sigma factor n=1 Tax=Constrictibacter sp. MBR-5 TaxID=3156467 RepID=UPI00339A76F9